MTRTVRAIAVQPQWHVRHYLSAQHFYRWMQGQLQQAQPHFHPTQLNLVVLTELNGLPLVLRGGYLAAYTGRFEWAAALMVLAYLPAVLWVMWCEQVSAIRALQLVRSGANVALYLRTCQQLARQYGVYLVCGSLPTPHYQVVQGYLRRSRELYNQTHIFSPTGELIGVTDKVHLTPDEQTKGVDLSPGHLHEMRVFPTPAGDLGVAISLDAFRDDVISTLEAQGCTVLLQPDANGGPWSAKEGLPPDPAHLRDQPEAWLESSWQVTTTGRIPYAINPMVVGNLLDMTFDGQSAITASAAQAPQLQSYAMTAPRPGFLALMPWLNEGPYSEGLYSEGHTDSQLHTDLEALRQLGHSRAAHSGHPHENKYRTGVLAADLELPPQYLAPPTATPHEQALRQWLTGQARLSTLSDTLTPLWPVVAGAAVGLAALIWQTHQKSTR